MLKDYQENLLVLLEQFEMEISNLYKLFAGKFPKYEDLWNELSRQEIEHAAHVKKLHDLAKAGKVIFNEKQTKTYTVKTVLEGVKNAYAKTQADKMTMMNALVISRDLEQSIIEKEFYNYFLEKDSDSRNLIHSIKQETHEHQSRVKQALDEERKAASFKLRP